MKKIQSEEISSILLNEIKNYEGELDVEEVGNILEVGDGIARIYGLANCMAGEMLDFGNDVYGLALNLDENNIGAVILGEYIHIREGDEVRRTGKVLSVPAGKALIGRVVNPLGQPMDGKGPIKTDRTRKLEFKAPGVVSRQPVKQPLQTGLKAVDSMIPIGRGQRELIIGDRGTGKTTIAVDAIINQKGQGVICVYVAIGQKASSVSSVVDRLRQHGAMDYTIVVMSAASDPAPMQYIAPYAGCAMAEEYMYDKESLYEIHDTLCIYDDLSKQATAYRQLSLLLRRPPGREAYPGDVFYLHSRLLERAAKLSDAEGGGSLTALPIIETQAGDVSAYIPTNVISITDGQIYLEPNLFFGGVRPAINVGISVSRVGGNAQNKAMKKIAGSLRLDLAQYRELEAFAQFGSDLDKATQEQLTRGERLVEILKQPQYQPMPVEEQIVLIYAGTKGYLDSLPVEDLGRFEAEFLEAMRTKYAEILKKIRDEKELTDKIDESLAKAIDKFTGEFKKSVTTEAKPG